jgi:hypothetical protein
MPEQDQQPLSHRNKYAADSACVHCEGIIRHESWCATQNISVHYAYQAVQDPNDLSLGDYFVLHALGVAWAKDFVKLPEF